MTNPRRLLTLAVLCCVQPCGAAPATRPATRTTRPRDPLRDAIVALIKEGVDAARANTPFPRDAPSFFDADAGAAIPQPALIAALARPQHANPRVDAYVKFQLLSAVPKTFDAANTVPAIKAYVLGAPAIIPMPALDLQKRSEWDGRQSAVNDPADVDRVNDDFAKQAEPVEQQDEIIVGYREAMRKRIAADGDDRVRLFAAEIEDVSQRAAAGLDEANRSFAKLATEIDKWATGTATRKQLDAMTKVVDEYASRRASPTIDEKLTWNGRTRHAKWTTRPAAIEPTKLSALKLDLLAAARAASS